MCINVGLGKIPTTNLTEHVLLFDFKHNNLISLKDFAFRGYTALVDLFLSYNEIEKVYTKAFHGLAMLKNIDLSHNKLIYIAHNIFSDNPHLETVSFRGNRLAYFPDSLPILASYSIESLDLSYCTLHSINSVTFSQLPNLNFLNLNSNHLHEIKWDHLKNLTELNNVDLGDNKWKCDCKILEVLNMLNIRRKSTDLAGEHKPVKCFKEGEYMNISTAEYKNNCTGQAEKEGSTHIEPKPEEKLARGTSTFFEPKDTVVKDDKPEIWNNNLFYGGIGVGIFICVLCMVLYQRVVKNNLNLRRILTKYTLITCTHDGIDVGPDNIPLQN
jgi:hypothetical protein